jgi:hypothetical protein
MTRPKLGTLPIMRAFVHGAVRPLIHRLGASAIA